MDFFSRSNPKIKDDWILSVQVCPWATDICRLHDYKAQATLARHATPRPAI